mmetsp:Transcript_44/g.61  ORF Transcript_44/g.61 Transcript_44/m.61 type:complete len:182 (-) Transcript_44:144-689(-)
MQQKITLMITARPVSRNQAEQQDCTSPSHENSEKAQANDSGTAEAEVSNNGNNNNLKNETSNNPSGTSSPPHCHHQAQDQCEGKEGSSSPTMSTRGDWQSKQSDIICRRRMVGNILKLMRSMSKQDCPEITRYAMKMECVLYHSAKSKEEYKNLSTLKRRLQMVAHGLGMFRQNSMPAAQA